MIAVILIALVVFLVFAQCPRNTDKFVGEYISDTINSWKPHAVAVMNEAASKIHSIAQRM